MALEIEAQPLTYGQAQGEILKLTEPISFWGGVDPLTGLISDIHHPEFGKSVVGKVLALVASRGSSSGSYILMELMRAGLAPAAIVITEPDGVICTGVLVGQETYKLECPVIEISTEALEHLESGFTGIVDSQPNSAYLLISIT